MSHVAMGSTDAMPPRPDLDHVTIGSIVVRCHAYERMFAIWPQALRYVVEHADPNGGFVVLKDPRGRGLNLSLDQSPTKRNCPTGADYVVLEDPDDNLFCVVHVPDAEVDAS